MTPWAQARVVEVAAEAEGTTSPGVRVFQYHSVKGPLRLMLLVQRLILNMRVGAQDVGMQQCVYEGGCDEDAREKGCAPVTLAMGLDVVIMTKKDGNARFRIHFRSTA